MSTVYNAEEEQKRLDYLEFIDQLRKSKKMELMQDCV